MRLSALPLAILLLFEPGKSRDIGEVVEVFVKYILR